MRNFCFVALAIFAAMEMFHSAPVRGVEIDVREPNGPALDGETKSLGRTEKRQVGTADMKIVEILLVRMQKWPEKTFLVGRPKAAGADKKSAIEDVRKANSWVLIENYDSVSIFHRNGTAIGVMKDVVERNSETKLLWDLLEKTKPYGNLQPTKKDSDKPRPKKEFIKPTTEEEK